MIVAPTARSNNAHSMTLSKCDEHGDIKVHIEPASCLLVPSNHVSFLGPIDTVKTLGYVVVTQVLHLLRGDVIVVVATLSMVTEAVRVLHAEVVTLSGS